MPDTKPFRIAHLSDLHLTAKEDASRSETKLYGALTGMNNAFRRVANSEVVRGADLVLVTGDVTDRGEEKAWRIFWEVVNKAGLKDKMLVIPGNHDVCCLGLRWPELTGNYREEDLEKARKGLRMGKQQVKFPWVWPADKKARVAVFGLNSNNLGNTSAATNALGELGFFQLLSFANKLHMYRDVPVKIVALHHSPNIPAHKTSKERKQPIYSDFTRLASQMPDWQRRCLRLLCATHGVRLIVHGHLHGAEDRRVNGVHIVGAPATTEPAKNSAGSLAYQIGVYTVSGAHDRVRCHVSAIPVNP